MEAAEQQLHELMRAEIHSGFLSSAYLECGSLDRPEPVFHSFYQKQSSPADVFDLASLTKALLTGPLVHQYLKTRNLSVLVPIRQWVVDPQQLILPEALLSLSADELLGHVSGLPAWWNFWIHQLSPQNLDRDRQQVLQHIRTVLARIPIAAEKAEVYSDVGYILLGYLLEQILGTELAQQFQQLRLQLNPSPLGVLGFPSRLHLPKERYIPTGICKLRECSLQGEVHDENCAALGGMAGHAGLFGNGPGLSAWLKDLFRHPLGFDYLLANEKQRLSSKRESLLGLRRGNGQSAVLFAAGQSMGHLGFTGTAFWLEMASRKYSIFLSNRVISGRLSTHTTELRRQVFQILDARLA